MPRLRHRLELVVILAVLFSIAGSLIAVPIDGPFGEWHLRTWFPQRLSGVAYGNGAFVVVGADSRSAGVILTSPDAVNWTTQMDVPGQPLNSVAFGNGKFVAVGGPPDSFATNIVLTSSDGTNWNSGAILRTSPPRTVVFGNGAFVAAGNGPPFTSEDGVRWTRQAFNSLYGLNTLTFENGRFVAVGYGTVATSTNGATWSPAQRILTDDLETVAAGNGLFVAAGTGAKVIRSIDGESWTSQTIKVGGSPVATFLGLGFGNGLFVLTGITYNGGYGVLYTSTDALSWTARKTVFNDVRTIGSGNGTLLALGDYAGIATSSDGIDWTVRRPGSALGLLSAAYGDGIFVAVGLDGGSLSSPAAPAVLRSTDGTNWLRSVIAGKGGLSDIAFGNGTFVAVGGVYYYSSSKTIFSSNDGMNWTQHLDDPSGVLNAVTWGNGRFVAVGDRGYMLSSPDGRTWDQSLTSTPDDLVSVAFGNGTFVAVGGPRRSLGSERNGVIYTSADGVSWAARDAGPGAFLQSVAFGNGTFVASRGLTAYLTSTHGNVWTPRDFGGRYSTIGTVQYVNGWFLASGAATWISPDGLTWPRTVKLPRGKIAQSPNLAVAVGGDSVWQTELIRRQFQVSVSASPFASESGRDVGLFKIRRSGPIGLELPIKFSIGGTAENGLDYESIPAGVLIEAGRNSVEIPVRARLDAAQEGIETVELTLQSGDQYEIVGPSTVRVFLGESSHAPRFRPTKITRLPDGAVVLMVELPPGGSFAIEASDDLKTWEMAQTVSSGPSEMEIRDNGATGKRHRFYRARQLAP